MNKEGVKMRYKDARNSKGESKKIMARLKEETKEYHAKLKSLAYFNVLIAHQLPLECYVNQLRSLTVIHGVFENEIVSSKDDRVLAIWDDSLKKLPLLE
jgi:hypothetical protein